MKTAILTYTIVVDVEDDEVPEELVGGPVEFYKLPDPVAEAVADAGNDYFKSVRGVEPMSVEFQK